VSQPTFDRNEEGRWSREGCAGAMWAAGSAWSDATQPGPLGEGRALFSGSSTTTTPARPIAEGLQRNGTAASPRSVWRSSGASSPVVKGELSRDEGSSESGSESRSALVSSPFAGGGGDVNAAAAGGWHSSASTSPAVGGTWMHGNGSTDSHLASALHGQGTEQATAWRQSWRRGCARGLPASAPRSLTAALPASVTCAQSSELRCGAPGNERVPWQRVDCLAEGAAVQCPGAGPIAEGAEERHGDGRGHVGWVADVSRAGSLEEGGRPRSEASVSAAGRGISNAPGMCVGGMVCMGGWEGVCVLVLGG